MYPNNSNPPYPSYPAPPPNQQHQNIGFSYGAPAPPYPPQGQPGPGYPNVTAPYPPQQQQPGLYPSAGGSPYPAQPQGGYPGYPPPTLPPTAFGQPAGYGQQANVPSYPPSPYGQQQQQAPVGSFGGFGPQQAQAPLYPSQPAQQAAPFGTNYSAAPSNYPTATMSQPQQQQDIPSIRNEHCDPQADAQTLRKAMKGFGTDENSIIRVVTRRTDAQRQAIVTAYKASFGKDLIKDLKGEISGRFEEIVMALMTPKYNFLAGTLNKAIQGLGTKESVLVDILCSSTNHDIHQINAAYQRMYGKPLENDLRGDTSGHFQRLLVSMCTGSRGEEQTVDQGQASQDAQALYNAGEGKWGTDESTFNMVLATRSFAHLRMVFHEYERLTGHSLETAVAREFSGDVQTGLLAIVKCARNRAAYFSSRLHDSISGFGTKDNDLIMLMVFRAEIDLVSVANEYHKQFNRSLANDISGDTSGDYKNALLGILGMTK